MKIITRFALMIMLVASFAYADSNDDLKLNQKVDFYYVAKDQPDTLVILVSDAYGPRPARYSVLSTSDIHYFQNLKEGIPYKCKFETKAAVCSSAAPDAVGCGYPYYKYIVSGLECLEAH